MLGHMGVAVGALVVLGAGVFPAGPGVIIVVVVAGHVVPVVHSVQWLSVEQFARGPAGKSCELTTRGAPGLHAVAAGQSTAACLGRCIDRETMAAGPLTQAFAAGDDEHNRRARLPPYTPQLAKVGWLLKHAVGVIRQDNDDGLALYTHMVQHRSLFIPRLDQNGADVAQFIVLHLLFRPFSA